MKILGPLTGLKTYEQVEKPGSGPGKGRSSSAHTKKGDSVELSSEGKLYSSALSEAQTAPEIRRAKVLAIKAQVDAGEYVPDTRKTAQKIVEEDLDLLI